MTAYTKTLQYIRKVVVVVVDGYVNIQVYCCLYFMECSGFNRSLSMSVRVKFRDILQKTFWVCHNCDYGIITVLEFQKINILPHAGS